MYLFRFITLTGVASAALTRRQNDTQRCVVPITRIEWRDLAPDVRQSYIDAVLCLKTKPSRIGLSTSLYDDFPYVHQTYNRVIHNVASFLPWHRYFGQIYEDALHDCGYTGALTYWDWTLDVLKLAQSPVMSSTLGFGGDGSDTRTEVPAGDLVRCVDSGPFANLRPSYLATSPRTMVQQEHCLFRQLTDGENNPDAVTMAQIYNSTYINNFVQTQNEYLRYHPALEGSPHGSIHASLGGEMNPTTSPNDPLFFLHHAQVDRIWWMWQQANLAQREFDYNGEAVTEQSDGNIMLVRRQAKLDDMLIMGGLAEDLSVRDVMTTNGRLCYKYAS